MSSNWYYYERDLDKYGKELAAVQYDPLGIELNKTQPSTYGYFSIRGTNTGPLMAEHVRTLLKQLAPPHGYELLKPLPLPSFPTPPSRPRKAAAVERDIGLPILSKYGATPTERDHEQNALQKEQEFKQKLAETLVDFEMRAAILEGKLNQVREKCEANDLNAVRFLLNLSNSRHQAHPILHLPTQFDFDESERVLLCTVDVPDFTKLKIQKPKGKSFYDTAPVSDREQKQLSEEALYSLCIRAGYLAAKSNVGGWYDTIAVNAFQKWNDRATGVPREGVVATLQGTNSDFASLHIDQIDAKSCFRHFKGLATPSIEDITPVRPIFSMDANDGRIVKERNVASDLSADENIASMPWEDFEHLVRQVFEWEFGRNGVEVKVFRASRDHGVDAVMYDPDPFRGGKYVLQAKRYTRTVDVAAVRDLYGTVINEGANRGILVTTSGYGPDSREFVKDKPLTLIDGASFLQMLKKHGRSYRIDLAEARRLNREE